VLVPLQVLNFAYKKLATVLTNWENWRTDQECVATPRGLFFSTRAVFTACPM